MKKISQKTLFILLFLIATIVILPTYVHAETSTSTINGKEIIWEYQRDASNNILIFKCQNPEDLEGEITIPDSVTSIGGCAFDGCTGLTQITIPDSVTSIGYMAFYGCEGLTKITIPDSVTSIEDGAFRDCSGLTQITIPKSVTNIDNTAFYGCDNLKIYCLKDSYADKFGEENNIERVYIDKNGTVSESTNNNSNEKEKASSNNLLLIGLVGIGAIVVVVIIVVILKKKSKK